MSRPELGNKSGIFDGLIPGCPGFPASDADLNVEGLAVATLVNPLERGDILIIPTDANLDMPFPLKDVVGGIVTDPNTGGGIHLHPGMTGRGTDQFRCIPVIVLDNNRVGFDVTTDVAGRKSGSPADGNHQMGKILTDSLPGGQELGDGGGTIGDAGTVPQVLKEILVQAGEGFGEGGGGREEFRGKFGDARGKLDEMGGPEVIVEFTSQTGLELLCVGHRQFRLGKFSQLGFGFDIADTGDGEALMTEWNGNRFDKIPKIIGVAFDDGRRFHAGIVP